MTETPAPRVHACRLRGPSGPRGRTPRTDTARTEEPRP
ncbi:hypothetical protein SUDANB13_05476 [Streptomyces sp. enrichment culture]